MDADTKLGLDSCFMRLGENAVRSAIVALVLTGQMLPAGSVSAQDGPPPPQAVAPDQPSAPPASEPAPTSAIAAESPPMVITAQLPPQSTVQEGTHAFGEWTITIRPGIVPAQPAPRLHAPQILAPVPQTSVSVPVTVHVNQAAFPYPWMWSVPSTYPTWWNAPTSAYLFQRPRPYWQLRGDFHHLRPFIPGLWY